MRENVANELDYYLDNKCGTNGADVTFSIIRILSRQNLQRHPRNR